MPEQQTEEREREKEKQRSHRRTREDDSEQNGSLPACFVEMPLACLVGSIAGSGSQGKMQMLDLHQLVPDPSVNSMGGVSASGALSQERADAKEKERTAKIWLVKLLA